MIDKSQIKQILMDQREEIPAILKRCWVERDIERQIIDGLADDLVKVIAGVRRCGKSGLAHRVLRDKAYGYVNFDDERLFGMSADALNSILEAVLELQPGARYLLFDEIQNVEQWELFVNRLQRSGYKIVLTGSNAHLLSRELATHLTGRHRIHEVYPYSFREYLRSCGEKDIGGGAMSTTSRASIAGRFAEYFKAGGFPEIGQVVNPRVYLQDLYDKVLTRDIAMRHGVRHIRTLKDIASYVANNCGAKLSYQNVKQAYGLGSIHTVKNYLAYMQDAYLFFAVEAFSFKIKARVGLPRKMYGIDVAMVRSSAAGMGGNTGLMLENVVFIELLRRCRDVHYYRDASGRHEVDYVCGRPGAGDIEFIQVCADMSAEETKRRELRGLAYAAGVFKDSPDTSLKILTLDYKGQETAGGRPIECIPVWEWMLGSGSA